MKKIVTFIICLFMFPLLTNAACTTAKSTETSKLAANVNISYEIDMSGTTPVYIITLNNLTDDMAIIDSVAGKAHKGFNNTGSELVIKTKSTGQYSFQIYSLACKEKVTTKSVTLPVYNAYYKDELCTGLEKYSLCQRWSGYKADRKTFESDIKKIKEDEAKLNQKEEEKVVEEKKWYEIAVDLFLDYWWAVVILLAGIIGLYYYILNRRKKNEYNFKV